MPQFLIDSSAIKDGVATITGSDAKHITTVLRLRCGDWLMITDGKGNKWRAELISASPKAVKVKLAILPSYHLAISPIILAQAMIKHDRFEWMIQKAVELGCSQIVPFISERTIPKFHAAKFVRWQKIADEAAKQCGTLIHPKIEQPIAFFELIKQLKPFEQKILFYEGENKNSLNTLTLKPLNTVLIIGPEGGFTNAEVAAARQTDIVTYSLGPLILRVETASIAALVLTQYKLGYFNKTT